MARAAGHSNGADALAGEDYTLASEIELLDLFEFALDHGNTENPFLYTYV